MLATVRESRRDCGANPLTVYLCERTRPDHQQALPLPSLDLDQVIGVRGPVKYQKIPGALPVAHEGGQRPMGAVVGGEADKLAARGCGRGGYPRCVRIR